MLPADSVYGPWPRSGMHPSLASYLIMTTPKGEIDLVESRGNGIQYTGRSAYHLPILWLKLIHLQHIQGFKLCSGFP